jgi:hypothetical protein
MRSLAKVLQDKDIIERYCQAFDYDNPRVLYLSSSDCFNLVVDDIDAPAYNDVLLANLLSDKLDCAINVIISENFTDSFKDEAPKRMATLEDVTRIQTLFKKPCSEIMIEDRDSEEITLARYEELKEYIIEAFKAKGLSSPYAITESNETTPTDKPSANKSVKRKQEKTNTTLFKDKKTVERDEEKDHRHNGKRTKNVEEADVTTKPSQFSRPTKS